MGLFGRHAEVPAEVGDGFVAGEAVALQTSFQAALTGRERSAREPVLAELQLEGGKGGRVVLIWRNVVVGFVPPAHEVDLRGQLHRAGKDRLVCPGQVYRDGDLWRVWVGARPPAGAREPEPGTDRLAAPPTRIFGLALPRPVDDDED